MDRSKTNNRENRKTTESDKDIYFVAGATGTVGRQVVSQLVQKGKQVRALTRNPIKANFNSEVEPVIGDLNQPKSFENALSGVTGIHLISIGGDNYAPLQSGDEIVDLLQKHEVKRVTVLWNGEHEKSTLEKFLKHSQLEYTILEPQEYMANVLGWTESIVLNNEVLEPVKDRPTAAIHERDIGAVAAKILVEGGHGGNTYVLTGPEVLTPYIQVETINNLLGRNIHFTELSENAAIERWKKLGYSDDLINYLVGWYSNPPFDGKTVSQNVEKILGRPALTFSDWVFENVIHFSLQFEQLQK
jgi:uncharacterized protein YbjT (DUF2867 family)